LRPATRPRRPRSTFPTVSRFPRAASIRNLKSALRNQQGRWFLVQIKEIVDFEEELAEAKN